jgi:hypothetical protein
MLQNGGILDGHRILSPTTVAFMTSDHLGQIGSGPTAYLPGPGYGFGLDITIKISGHPPFPAQIMLNGHEYVACQARKAGITFTI